jgi:methyl-accepting chemotaxis protein
VAAATEQASADNLVTVASAGAKLSASVKEISRQATQSAQTVEAADEVARVNGHDARIARIAGNIAHRSLTRFALSAPT